MKHRSEDLTLGLMMALDLLLPENQQLNHLKIDGWKLEDELSFLGVRPIFSGELLVLGNVGNPSEMSS